MTVPPTVGALIIAGTHKLITALFRHPGPGPTDVLEG
jgi:hypothetical protein